VIRWSSGWRPLEDPMLRCSFERELARELEGNPDHVLASRRVEVIGGLGGCDDFIVRLDGADSYAWVHLSWNRENWPGWPTCALIGGPQDLDDFLASWAQSGETGD
jgi:hypothetical protein